MEKIFDVITREVVLRIGRKNLALNGLEAETFEFKQDELEKQFFIFKGRDCGLILNSITLFSKDEVAKRICYMLSKTHFAYSKSEVGEGLVGFYAKDEKNILDYYAWIRNFSKQDLSKEVLEKLKFLKDNGFSVFFKEEGLLCINHSLIALNTSVVYLRKSVYEYLVAFENDYIADNMMKIVEYIVDDAVQEEVTIYGDSDLGINHYTYSGGKEAFYELVELLK